MTTEQKTYQHTIAKIEGTFLGIEDHGMFSLAVHLSYGGSGQGFGHIGLDGENYSIASPLIKAILRAGGVECWERLAGRTVYAIRDEGWNGFVRGLAPLPTEGGKGFVLIGAKVEEYEVPR